MTAEYAAAGDPIPPACKVIEVHVGELRQLFNAIDPAPFRERDLDPRAEEFIVGWGRELPRNAPLALLVHVDRPSGVADEAAQVRDAVRQYFADRADATRHRLRRLFHLGRISLLIGLAVLGTLVALGQVIVKWTGGSGLGIILHETLSIGGWVAMWRPLEVFLYDWWPVKAEARLYDRLAVMPVRLVADSSGGVNVRRSNDRTAPGRMSEHVS